MKVPPLPFKHLDLRMACMATVVPSPVTEIKIVSSLTYFRAKTIDTQIKCIFLSIHAVNLTSVLKGEHTSSMDHFLFPLLKLYSSCFFGQFVKICIKRCPLYTYCFIIIVGSNDDLRMSTSMPL